MSRIYRNRGFFKNMSQSIIEIYKKKNLFELDDQLAQQFSYYAKKNSNILVSGGTTFLSMYKNIIKKNNISKKATLSLTDERIAPSRSRLLNYTSLKYFFLDQTNSVNYKSIYSGDDYFNSHDIILKKAHNDVLDSEIDIGFIGVGNDGHIASIFNDAKIIKKRKKLSIVKRGNEKFSRITHNLESLLMIPCLIVVFRGREKSNMFYSSILNVQKKNKKYKNIGVIKKLIKLYKGKLVILTN